MFLTIDELAGYLKISRETIYKMAQKGSIPAVKVGVQWRFDQEDIDNWIENNRNSKSRELNSARNQSSIRNLEE